MSYWVQVIYILAVADVMGFIMLAILFYRMKHDFGWILAFLFATSALINITGTVTIAHGMSGDLTVHTVLYGLSRAVRIIAQTILILKLIGVYRSEVEERSDA